MDWGGLSKVKTHDDSALKPGIVRASLGGVLVQRLTFTVIRRLDPNLSCRV